MSIPATENEAPITLRATSQLSRPSVESSAPLAADEATPGAVPQVEARVEPSGAPADYRIEAIALATAGVAVIASFGWVMERRYRLARRTPSTADLTVADVVVAGAVSAPPQRRRSDRSKRRVRSAGSKMLIKLLFMGRTVAGASAILAAIAIAVFWSIELTDAAPGEPSLNMALAGVLLAGCVGFWLSGRLANMVHRSVFGRDHPKFAD